MIILCLSQTGTKNCQSQVILPFYTAGGENDRQKPDRKLTQKSI